MKLYNSLLVPLSLLCVYTLAHAQVNCTTITGFVALNQNASQPCLNSYQKGTNVTDKFDATSVACLYSLAACQVPYAATPSSTTGGGAFSATGQCGLMQGDQQIPNGVNCPAQIQNSYSVNASSLPGSNYYYANGIAETQNSGGTACVSGAQSAYFSSSCTAYACGTFCSDDDDDDDDDDCLPNGSDCDDNSDCCSGTCDDGMCGDVDPIIIDLSGSGYQLTNAAGGVKFDFYGIGAPIQMSWTAAGWNGGFLALDRNGNGKIDNATEMFSNVSPQEIVTGKGRNGFLALALYDQPSNGGNGDGWITKEDSIFPKLLVWVDKNHNGVTDPGELVTLAQAGIEGISLGYSAVKFTDMYGNIFRYEAAMRTGQSSARVVYDVILQEAGRPNVTPTATGQQ